MRDEYRPAAVCVACRIVAPATATPYTLSGRFSWRLKRTKHATGRIAVAWYCPKCWADVRGSKHIEHG